MTTFFTFLQTYRAGILLLLLILTILVFLLQWLAWIFARGRFKRSTPDKEGADVGAQGGPGDGTGGLRGTGDGTVSTDVRGRAARFILTEAATKLINEFRHLLALLIIVIFSFALAFSLIKAGSLTTGSAVDNMKEALGGVVATLGGLVGSIIGYYFGESSVVKPTEPKPAGSPGTEAVQKPPKDQADPNKAPGPPDPPSGAPSSPQEQPGAPSATDKSTGS